MSKSPRPPVLEQLARRGQAHLVEHWESLAASERERFAAELAGLDLDLVERLVAEHVRGNAKAAPAGAAEGFEPVEVVRLPKNAAEEKLAAAARAEGEKALAAGKVAALVVAGGQGSRLGFPGPKGAFAIGPVTDRTLFQIHVEKLRALARRCRRPIPLLVLTSDANEAETRDFFRARDRFGLAEPDLVIFRQGSLPAVDRQGRLLLAAPGRLFLSPNGHGGTLAALKESGALAALRKRGVTTLFYFQVDNPLVALCDPAFLGHHLRAGAGISSKVLMKNHPLEKLGVIGRRGTRAEIVEYSDLPEALARATQPDGMLRFAWGSIAIHVLALDFVERMAAAGLPYHKAVKKIPAHGGEVEGVKFEAFIFDAIPADPRALFVECAREEEFSPVKNATGVDSVESCRRDLAALYGRWLKAAGVAAPPGTTAIEISPLFADNAAELAARVRTGAWTKALGREVHFAGAAGAAGGKK